MDAFQSHFGNDGNAVIAISMYADVLVELSFIISFHQNIFSFDFLHKTHCRLEKCKQDYFASGITSYRIVSLTQ
jgi:hypothetical protein